MGVISPQAVCRSHFKSSRPFCLRRNECFGDCAGPTKGRNSIHPALSLFLFVYTTTHCSLKAYCAILVRCSNFRYQGSPRVSPRESTQRRKVELWAKNVKEFCLNADLHVTFRNLLHVLKLRHATDGFTSPPKEDFFHPKNPTTSAGCQPANLGTKGQHATSRPPKPLALSLSTKMTELSQSLELVCSSFRSFNRTLRSALRYIHRPTGLSSVLAQRALQKVPVLATWFSCTELKSVYPEYDLTLHDN